MQSLDRSNGNDRDDWSKIEDKARRKTVQNRLAQRKRRLKLAGSKAVNSQTQSSPKRLHQHGMDSETLNRNEWLESNCSDHRPSNALPQLNEGLRELAVSRESCDRLSSSSLGNAGYISPELGLASRSSFINYLASALGTGLVEHRFIHLTQYSVFRAYLANASLLSLPHSLLLDEDALSPYTVMHPFSAITTPLTHTLSPTDIQLSTYHHPYVDVIASPSLRNNVLMASLDEEKEEALCMDLHCNGFTVWGSQPWNSMCWEVAQEFASKWAWLLDEDTIRYSNFWRTERGELPLQVTYLE